MERITTVKGDSPILVIVPHGFDDPNTAIIGERIIKELDAFGVINRGWERADRYDYYSDKANCNNIEHCMEDVVKDEFFDPIVRYVENIKYDLGSPPNVFIIHGVSNAIRAQAPDLDLIMGYGEGKPASHTCEEWYLTALMALTSQQGFNPYRGKAGGQYSARRKQNLNQLFRLYDEHYDDEVFSVQIEVIRNLRDTAAKATITGDLLSNAIEDVVELRNSDKPAVVMNNHFPFI